MEGIDSDSFSNFESILYVFTLHKLDAQVVKNHRLRCVIYLKDRAFEILSFVLRTENLSNEVDLMQKYFMFNMKNIH